MDSCNESIAKADISPKSKQKKKSLCQMLMNKKTKVGCLEASQRDGEHHRNSKMENSHSSTTSTKLSLCCAMTERSRTPPQSLTVSRLSPTLSRTSMKSEVVLHEENYQETVLENEASNSRAMCLPINNIECCARRNKTLGKDRQSICAEGEMVYLLDFF